MRMAEEDRVADRSEPNPSTASAWDAATMLCWREILRFFRQRNRVIGAFGQPLLFWLLFGAGLDRSLDRKSTRLNSSH